MNLRKLYVAHQDELLPKERIVEEVQGLIYDDYTYYTRNKKGAETEHVLIDIKTNLEVCHAYSFESLEMQYQLLNEKYEKLRKSDWYHQISLRIRGVVVYAKGANKQDLSNK